MSSFQCHFFSLSILNFLIHSNSIADSGLQKHQHYAPTSTSIGNRNRIGRRKGTLAFGSAINDNIFSSHSPPPIDMFFMANSSSRQQLAAARMDNFEPLHQIFNATLFDMAIPLGMERKKGGGGGKGHGGGTNSNTNQQPLWRWALPWAMSAERKQKQQQKVIFLEGSSIGNSRAIELSGFILLAITQQGSNQFKKGINYFKALNVL
jgi:hypothetical protein